VPGINISTSTIITTTFIYKYILEKRADKNNEKTTRIIIKKLLINKEK